MITKRLKFLLEKQQQENLIRTRNLITNEALINNQILVNENKCINFSNNDYLSLMQHKKIKEDFISAINKYGFGSGASVFISGFSDAHSELEQQFAKWLKTDNAILFSSGYLANVGVISTLANHKNTIFSDKLIHASLLDGIILSRAKHFRYKHCDIKHINNLAIQNKPDFIISETIFSMEGDIAPINNLVTCANNHNANLILDDAHGIGLFSTNGSGICNLLDVTQNDFSYLITPLGKTFNAIGAIVAGKNENIDYLIQLSRAYRYTTAPPPAVCLAILSALNIIKTENWRREQLIKNIKFFINYAKEKNISLVSEDITPIKTIIIRDSIKVLELQNFLLHNGFYVAAIRPPTVPNNSSRLRISLNTLHTKKEIKKLINLINNWIYSNEK